MINGLKSILVGMTEEGVSEASSALGYALSLAQQAQAHLTVQSTSVRIKMHHAVVSDFAQRLIAAENNRLQALAEAAAQRSRAEADAAGVTCTVESKQLAYSDLLQHFVTQSRVNDLSILDAETATVEVDRGLIESLLLEGGHPLLLVPPSVDTFRAGHMVVAWDASAPAARAAASALPLLRAAQSVSLVSIADEKTLARSVPGAEAALWLARHGVNVEEVDLPRGPEGIATTLLRYLERTPADMLVMGAYKHSLFWEWVAGGVTQSLLKENPVPLFLSH